MSEAKWTLSVKDFGPIKSASVTLAPFTVFTGRNNTGKSYMASLIWALLNANDQVLRPEVGHGAACESAHEVVHAIQRGEKLIVTDGDWLKLAAWINQALADRPANVIGRIFGRDGFAAGHVQADLTSVPGDLPVRMMPYEALDNVRQRPHRQILSTTEFDGVVQFSALGEPPAESPAFDRLMLSALLRLGLRRWSTADYLPAARTGLVLALKPLIGNILSQGDETSYRPIPFTAPVRDFLSSLGSMAFATRNHLPLLAERLEKNVLGGEIRQINTGDIYYVPDGLDGDELPLYATSSLITELTPFILLLKRGIYGALIFEEPEAHLHLTAQREVARTLVRLVNTGTPVLITTHSDTFLQQINMLIRLSTHPARDALAKKFGYEPEDLLHPSKAAGYEFIKRRNGTVVRPLEKTRLGFVEPEMNQTIAEMSREIIEMGRRDTDA